MEIDENAVEVVIEESTNLLRALLLAGGVVLAFLILGMVLHKVVVPLVQKRLHPEKHEAVAILLNGFKRPVSAYLKVTCFLCVLLTLAAWLPTGFLPGFLERLLLSLPPLLETALRVTAVVAVAWGLVQSSSITGLVLKGARKQLDVRTSKSVNQFLGAIFKVVVVAVAAVILLSEFNYDINGLIAGLGLGGLTVALAAQNSAANFFGGLVIVLEKPFEIGDYIVCKDVVEGTVEEISLRSTRIRLSDGAMVTVPNSTLSDSALTNWGGDLQRRRASYSVGLTYSTSRASVLALTEGIRALLDATEGVQAGSSIVRFTDFTESSLSLTIIYNTSPGYADHLAIKERVNIGIMKLVEDCPDAGFAFPTRTVYMADGADPVPPKPSGKAAADGRGGNEST